MLPGGRIRRKFSFLLGVLFSVFSKKHVIHSYQKNLLKNKDLGNGSPILSIHHC